MTFKSFLVAAFLVVGLLLFGAPRALAAALWCVLEDDPKMTAYLSDPRDLGTLSSSRVRKLSERFRRATGTDSMRVRQVGETCRRFRDRKTALVALGATSSRLRTKGYQINMVGIF